MNSGGTATAGFAMDQTFLNRIVAGSQGVVALGASSSNNLDFSSDGANLTSASLGAVGNVTYTGTLTPNGTTYRLGGGGGTLTLSNSNALTGSNDLIADVNGTSSASKVILGGSSNNYAGATTINAGTLQFNSDNAIGGIGASVTVNSGGTAAAGFAMDQTFLDRIVASSQGVVALGASSSNDLDFSSGAANLTNASLGAVGTVAYTGTLTLNGTTYRLGGGGGSLTLSDE